MRYSTLPICWPRQWTEIELIFTSAVAWFEDHENAQNAIREIANDLTSYIDSVQSGPLKVVTQEPHVASWLLARIHHFNCAQLQLHSEHNWARMMLGGPSLTLNEERACDLRDSCIRVGNWIEEYGISGLDFEEFDPDTPPGPSEDTETGIQNNHKHASIGVRRDTIAKSAHKRSPILDPMLDDPSAPSEMLLADNITAPICTITPAADTTISEFSKRRRLRPSHGASSTTWFPYAVLEPRPHPSH